MDCSRDPNVIPIYISTSSFDMALLSIVLAVAHIKPVGDYKYLAIQLTFMYVKFAYKPYYSLL